MADDRGILVVISGPSGSGRSTLASDEVVPWLRKQGEGRVVLVDVGVPYVNVSAIEADISEGYHVCMVTNDDRLRTKADLLLEQGARTTFTTHEVKSRLSDHPWIEKREMPF